MPSALSDYAIDDGHSAEQNVAAFADALRALDPMLGDTLSSHLLSMSHGNEPDGAAILDALYAATAAPEQAEGDAEDGVA